MKEILKKITSAVVAVVMLVSLLPGGLVLSGITALAAAGEWGGAGTASNPYTISDAQGLAKLASDVNGGTTYYSIYFKLTANIDLSSYTNWTPIGTFDKRFMGNFDGGGKTVLELTVNNTKAPYQGLFGVIGVGGVVKNVALKYGSVYARDNVGGIAGLNYGTISGCRNENVSVTAMISSAGGIAGENHGTVSGCKNSADVCVENRGDYSGGIAGANRKEGIITNCSNKGIVSGCRAGGITGYNFSIIEKSYNMGDLLGEFVCGGIAAYNDGRISYCYNSGDIITDGQYVASAGYSGGIAGGNHMDAIIEYSYNTGSVTSGWYYSGGISGFNGGILNKCYSVGSVHNNKKSFKDDYGMGAISGGHGMGYYNIKITDCYYSTDVYPAGTGDGQGEEGTIGLSTAEFAQSGFLKDYFTNAENSE